MDTEQRCSSLAGSFTFSAHTLMLQIVRINGTSTDDDGVVIIGAHQDRCVL